MAVVDTEKYRMIRRLYTVEGLSQRQIARQLGVSRDTVCPRQFKLAGIFILLCQLTKVK